MLKLLPTKSRFFIFDSTQQKERLSCIKCKDIMIKPFQSECGSRFCSFCFKDSNTCPGCNNNYDSVNVHIRSDKAVEKEMLELPIKCIHIGCQNNCKLKNFREHLKICEYREDKCLKCNESYPHNKEKEHNNVSCKMIKTTCKDCQQEMTKKELNEEHKNINEKIDLLCTRWRGVCPYHCCEEEYENLKMHLYNCSRRPIECVLKELGCTKFVSKIDMNDHIKDEEVYHIKLIAKNIEKVKKENIQSKSVLIENSQRQTLEIEKLKDIIEHSSIEIENLSNKVTSCQKKHDILQKEKNTFQKRYNDIVEELPKEIYGECIWHVDNIIDKINLAKEGVNSQILSQPFYSANPGYKLCLKMYPNGDGKGFGNYISIYFVLMKGKFDDDIQWPFTCAISMSILNKRKGCKDRTIVMRPNTNASCYNKPTAKFNVAAGEPKFISHLELINSDEFLENGSLTVQAKIK